MSICLAAKLASASCSSRHSLVSLLRHNSRYTVHPEVIKQVVKQRDAYMLCKFFDSDEYKRKVSEFLEMQNRLLSSNNKVVKYEHILSCAQPAQKRRKVSKSTSTEEDKMQTQTQKRKNRGTVIEMILDKKNRPVQNVDKKAPTTILNLMMEKRESKRKNIRQTTTILPLFLKKKKLRDKELQSSKDEEEYEELVGTTEDHNDQVYYPEKEGYSGIRQRIHSALNHKGMKTLTPRRFLTHNTKSINLPPSYQIRRKTTYNISHNNNELKKHNYNKKHFSQLLHEYVENEDKSKHQSKKKISGKKRDKTKKELKADNLEGRCIMYAIKKKNAQKSRSSNMLMSLFNKVKSGTCKNKKTQTDLEEAAPSEYNVDATSLKVSPVVANIRPSAPSSYTYKIVTTHRNAANNDKFKVDPKYWKYPLNLIPKLNKVGDTMLANSVVKVNDEIDVNEELDGLDDDVSVKTGDIQTEEEIQQEKCNIFTNFRGLRQTVEKCRQADQTSDAGKSEQFKYFPA